MRGEPRDGSWVEDSLEEGDEPRPSNGLEMERLAAREGDEVAEDDSRARDGDLYPVESGDDDDWGELSIS